MEKYKVIFLDIDGVLNHTETGILQSTGLIKIDMDNEEELAQIMIEPECIEILNEIVEKSGAKLVLSSTWFAIFGLEKTERILKLAGLKHNLIAATPRKMSSQRCHEIKWYLDNNPNVENFVILDDTPNASLFFDDLKKNHIQTYLKKSDGKGGLQPAHIDAALIILN